jgi:predicted transposase/invertase (TIGR01784 family)
LEELETNTDKWLYCLKNMKRLEAIPEKLKGSIHERMFEKVDDLTPTEMKTYKKSVLEYSDVRSAVSCARKEGKEEGIEIKSIAVAKKSLLKGISIADIAELTELTPEQIRDIALTIQPNGSILN